MLGRKVCGKQYVGSTMVALSRHLELGLTIISHPVESFLVGR